MGRRRLYVETLVRGDLDVLWHRTQDPREHARWDLRFSRIAHLAGPTDGPTGFTYALRLPLLGTLTGVGVSAGERRRPDGTRTSVLRFRADSRRSPLQDGSGFWRYVPAADGTGFITGYDYEPGPQGDLLDRTLVRPFVGWLTAWGFDRLRLWCETGVAPETLRRRWWSVVLGRAVVATGLVVAGVLPPAVAAAGALAALAIPVPVVRPLARRCRRQPDPAAARPPAALARLGAPADAQEMIS